MRVTDQRLVTIRRRSDGREGATFDVTGMSPREFDRLWDGLVIKVDFAVWCPEYTPPRDDDQSAADWLGDRP